MAAMGKNEFILDLHFILFPKIDMLPFAIL